MQEPERDLKKLELIYLKNTTYHRKQDEQFSRLNLTSKEIRKEAEGFEDAKQAQETLKDDNDRLNDLNEFLANSSSNAITQEETNETIEVLSLLNENISESKAQVSEKYPSKLLLLEKKIRNYQISLILVSSMIVSRLIYEIFFYEKSSVDILSDNKYLYNLCYVAGLFIITYNVVSLFSIRKEGKDKDGDDYPIFYNGFICGRLMFSFAICYISIKMYRFFNYDMYWFTQSQGEDGDINGSWYSKVILLCFDFSFPPLIYTVSAKLLRLILIEKSHFFLLKSNWNK